MQMLEIAALSNGAHDNQTYNGTLPDGWALVPDDMDCPNFPFGEVEAEEVTYYREVINDKGEAVKESYTLMTVTKWTAGEMPEPTPLPEPKPTADELMDILLGVQ